MDGTHRWASDRDRWTRRASSGRGRLLFEEGWKGQLWMRRRREGLRTELEVGGEFDRPGLDRGQVPGAGPGVDCHGKVIISMVGGGGSKERRKGVGRLRGSAVIVVGGEKREMTIHPSSYIAIIIYIQSCQQPTSSRSMTSFR